MERETGIEPATNSLEGCDSTIELLPLVGNRLTDGQRYNLIVGDPDRRVKLAYRSFEHAQSGRSGRCLRA